MKIAITHSILAALAALAFAAGCGGRPDGWSRAVGNPQVVGLASSVALIDTPADRVVSLSVESAANDLVVTRVPTGRDIVAAAPAPDGSALYVLTAGHRASLGDTLPDELPRMMAIPDQGGDPENIDLGLTDPLDGLAVDPAGHWAVVYAASKSGAALVTNPNDLVLVDLASTPRKAYHHTLHSFGGRPDGFIFTPSLTLAGEQRQLLIVKSQRELALVVLNPAGISDSDEVTVFLSDATAATSPAPAQVVVDAGGSGQGQDPQIGIRFANDTSVMTLQLGAATTPTGFKPSVNVADVGGVPSDIAFVRTDGGLRLAALVPAGARAMLVDPLTSITTEVDLPASYQRISLVTRDPSVATTDLALLWQGRDSTAGVAFWELGQAAGRPFRSIETVGVSGSVSDVLDVPRQDLPLKVLATSGANTFYVLDLGTRTAAPLITSQSSVVLTVSPGGQRVWTFAPRGEVLASTDLTGKQVRTLRADTPIDAVFEIGRTGDAGRALIALHTDGAVGATVYDADTQDDTKRRIYGALLEEGPYADQ